MKGEPFRTEKGQLQFVNLIGTMVGSARVVGLLKADRQRKGAIWIIRCSCGESWTTRTKHLKHAINGSPTARVACLKCHPKGGDDD